MMRTPHIPISVTIAMFAVVLAVPAFVMLFVPPLS